MFDLIQTITLFLNYLNSELKFIPEFSNVSCLSFDDYISRKSEKEPLLQTDELNQQQAMQKAEEVHQFRQYRTRVLSIRDTDQDERFKLKDEILDMYAEMRVSLKVLTWITVEKFFCNIKEKIIQSYMCVERSLENIFFSTIHNFWEKTEN